MWMCDPELEGTAPSGADGSEERLAVELDIKDVQPFNPKMELD